MPLTDTQIRKLKPSDKCTANRPDKYSDANGLQLWVRHTGNKVWISAYRYLDKQQSLTLGKYPALGLADARVKTDRLENWLIHYCRENNQTSVPRADVLQRVTPTNLRKAKALDNVLKILIDNNHIKEVKANNKAYIELNPLLFEYK